MPSCAIITCRIRSQSSNLSKGGISFHRFPKNPNICKKWIEATGRENWFPTRTSTICSKHFDENDYAFKKSGYKYLNIGAVPHEKIVHLHSSTTKRSSSPPNLFIDDQSREKDIVDPLSTSTDIADPLSMSTSRESQQILQINTSNILIIPPLVANLSSNAATLEKKKLKSIVNTKDAIIQHQRKMIKTVQAQNRRLKKKISKMEVLINDLQERLSSRPEDLSITISTNVPIKHEP
ncbi:hypothetical protein evm_006190 [Chilo suppressalis]|nr:hypothetical protein evm_006190 [Chilo suppressalis]